MIGTFLQGTIKLIIASSDYKDFDAPLIITLYDYDRHFREWIGLLGEVMELWDSIVNIFFILFQMLQSKNMFKRIWTNSTFIRI